MCYRLAQMGSKVLSCQKGGQSKQFQPSIGMGLPLPDSRPGRVCCSSGDAAALLTFAVTATTTAAAAAQSGVCRQVQACRGRPRVQKQGGSCRVLEGPGRLQLLQSVDASSPAASTPCSMAQTSGREVHSAL